MGSWRLIIRFSLNSDVGSKVRNFIKGWMDNQGVMNTATGTWESPAISLTAASIAVQKLMETVAAPLENVPTADSSVELDHLWVYLDKGGS